MSVSKNDQTKAIAYSTGELMRDLWKLSKPYKLRFIGASIIRLSGDLVWLFPAYAFSKIVNVMVHFKVGDSLMPVWKLLILMVAAVFYRSFSQFTAKLLGNSLAEKMALNTVQNSIQHQLALDMAWHETRNSGNKIKKTFNAAEGVNKIIRMWFQNFIEIGVNLIAINLIILKFNPTLVVILIIFLVTYFILSSALNEQTKKAYNNEKKLEEEANGIIYETINNIRTVKVMSIGKHIHDMIKKTIKSLYEKITKRIFWAQTRIGTLRIYSSIIRVLILALIIVGITQGKYEIGFLVLFNSYFSDLFMSIDELAMTNEELSNAKINLARIKEITDEPIRIENNEGKSNLKKNWDKIIFKNVSFSYGGKQVLNRVNFEVKRGEKVGIVGLSGAGKSTLFKMLLKERENFMGEIRFNDQPIENLQKENYFKQVSVVLQDTEVFDFTFEDNIKIVKKNEKGDDRRFKNALKIAHLGEMIQKLPQGIKTLIGEKGVKLSGGERQRLGIARAVYKEPQLLLLDEATSHLDLESEEKIKDSLHHFFEKVTAIVIAHRLTTIKEMDKILVMEKGTIVESGNFETLMAQKGRFYELWEKQRL